MRDSHENCDEIQSLAINSTPEKTGVTSFVQEASDCTIVLPEAVKLGTMIPVENDLQNLTKYYARPVAIASGSFGLGTSGLEYSYGYSSFLDALNHFPTGTGRLTGVYGIRASIVYTLQVAATPFHQGIVCLNFQYGENGSSVQFLRNAFSATSTNLPHVRLDLSEDTMVQLKVPFLSVSEYVVVSTSNNNPRYGVVGLNTLLPIPAIPGLTAPQYQILVHLEDVELFGAYPVSSTDVNFQAGRKLAPVTEEFEQESHPFSSGTMALSRAARFFSKGIPLISSIGGPTSWFLEKTAGVIRSFGYSKPSIVDPIQRMQRNDNINEHNTDVASGALVVGPFANNTLGVTPTFGGTDVDEMSLRYITKQPSQINRFFMDVANPAGTLLYATPVSPSCFWFRATTTPSYNVFPLPIAPAGTSGFIPSNLFFFGQMFKFWRGGIKFKFTFAKAKLHGGRVMVNFVPSNKNDVEANRFNGTAQALRVADFGAAGPNPFGYSAIFNLRDGNSFEFEVPYISPMPYTAFCNAIGTVSLHVVDALQSASVISTNISCMVEVVALDDFEFADPRTVIYPAHVGATVQFQSGRLLGHAPDALSQHTVGESINSVKQLISIPKFVPVPVAANTRYNATVPPWFYQPRPIFTVPAPSSLSAGMCGLGGNIACCYAFVRGSTDIHVYPNNASEVDTFVAVRQLPGLQGLQSTSAQPGNLPASNNVVVASGSGALHARLPAYQHLVRYFACCLNNAIGAGSSWAFNGTLSPTALSYGAFTWPSFYSLTMVTNSAVTAQITRNAADDAALAMFMGPPPVLLVSANAATTVYDPDSAPVVP